MADAMGGLRRRPKVLGGSLTRAPDGVLVTVLTTSLGYPTPLVVQEIWSNARKRSYPKAWDGAQPPPGIWIRWRDAARFLCGRCGRSLGHYVAYHVRSEYGIVEDTAKRYHPRENFASRPPGAAERRAPSQPRFLRGGNIGRAATTTALFRCPKCGYVAPPYNLARLGRTLFDTPRSEFRVGEDSIRQKGHMR
jgi:predicted RNA-binding Zn-ribbon protein involved in translation (DUF1610 family)